MKNLDFHSLLRLKDDSCTSSHYLTYNVLFELGIERVNPFTPMLKKHILSVTGNITSHGMKKVAFHSLLRWKMINQSSLPQPKVCISMHFLGRMYFLNLRVNVLTPRFETTVFLYGDDNDWYCSTVIVILTLQR